MWQLQQPGPATFERHDVPEPTEWDLRDGQVLLRFLAGAVCGSDIPKFLGQFDPDNPCTGGPGAPLHEFVGRVEASRADRFVTGDRVVGSVVESHGLAEYVINYGAYMHGLDDRFSDVEATVVQPLATVLSALSHVSDVAGRTVAVLGLGPLGLLFTQVAKARGAAHVVGVDRIDRNDVGQDFGIDQVVTSGTREWATELADADRPDLVVDAIGHRQEVLTDAVEAAAFGGELLVFGLPEDHYVFPMRTYFRKGLTMWGGTTKDWPRFLAAAEEHVLKYDVLTSRYVTDTMSVFDAQEAYRTYATPAKGRLKVALTPPA